MDKFQDVCRDLGQAGEEAVADLIRGRGHQVRLDGGNHLHDLVVEGVVTVEVKTALPTAANGNRHDRWQFNLYDTDGYHQPVLEDVLVLRCQHDRNGGGADHFVIPGSLLPAGLTKLDITSHPRRYAGKYSLFLDAWELLDAVVALGVREGSQLPLAPEIPW